MNAPISRRSRYLTLAVALALALARPAPPAEPADVAAAWIRSLDGRVLTDDSLPEGDRSDMLAREIRTRVQAASIRENEAWQRVQTRAEWERFRDQRVRALRESLGLPAGEPNAPPVLVTREFQGEGYRIANLVFASRPGLVVTANLYEPAPARPGASLPGLLICHSHHNPKSQGELQDMGMTWARQGCVVLVPDHINHGERRQHPFRTEADYRAPFRAGRQDYYFRSTTGAQLYLNGESLMGWMVWDLMRGLDVLLSRPGVDRNRIIVLGAVAGGGDPAAVTAALDPRVQAVAPFNFGGPQPDYPVPADPARDFYFFGVPGWESTRCLRLGARDGFAQWLIVAAAAPRRLVYAHEFAWDRARDPIWPRLETVFAWYGTGDGLAAAEGRGSLKGTPPESSHCNNIGPLHRSRIYPVFERWFGMPVPAEYSARRAPEELLCLNDEAIRRFQPRPLHALAAAEGARRAALAREHLAGLDPEARRRALRGDWARLLGDVEPEDDPEVRRSTTAITPHGTVERIALAVGRGVVVPVLLLRPPPRPGSRPPVVLALAQEGKQVFLDQRSESIAQWLAGGAAVCLADVRGTGETRPRDGSRRHNGSLTALAHAEWMLGRTLVGARLRDVRSVLRFLRGRSDLDARRVALWGDSFAPTNPADRDLSVPLDAEPFPDQAEPLGGLLALLGALFEEDVRAVYVRGGLIGFETLLQSPFLYVPHDALIPGAVTVGDLCGVASALAPRALWLEDLVDGLDRRVSGDKVARILEPVEQAYRGLGAEGLLRLGTPASQPPPALHWLLRHLQAD
jgi:cephalosporin-C deacetylase-like acetyl esterase